LIVCYESSDTLSIKFGEDAFGKQVKLSMSSAKGIINELSMAALAPGWKSEMLQFIEENNAMHPDVIDLYTMGDLNLDDKTSKIVSFRSLPVKQKNRVDAFQAEVHLQSKNRKDFPISLYSTFKYSKGELKNTHSIPDLKDLSSMMDECNFLWTWGMKSLFQRCAIRKIGGKWHLWPFAQPPVNNRKIDVEKYLWNEVHPKKQTMMKSILTTPETGFDSQTAYSIPYCAAPVPADETEQPGPEDCIYLEAMVAGVRDGDSGDEFIFKDLKAFTCRLTHMEECFEAFVVSFQWLF
jgi:hypothetical protein